MPLATLPALAFGDHQSRQFRSVSEATDEGSRLIPGLLDYEFLDRDNLGIATSLARVNGLSLVACSTSSSRITFGDRPEPVIGLPVAGLANFKADRISLSTESARTAAFVPMGHPTRIVSGDRSAVIARLEPASLQRTARTMLGVASDDNELLTLSNPREIGLQVGSLSVDAVFRNLFAQIDLHAGNPEMLDLTGIDDVFYRNVVIAMAPERFLREIEMRKVPADRRRLARVCEHVMANLSKTITLTELERIGHMSRRTLHNAFMKAYQLSPMAWVREQRLLKAHGLLSASAWQGSVTEILYACGFTNASRFSMLYAHRFGELPSVTLARLRKSSRRSHTFIPGLQ